MAFVTVSFPLYQSGKNVGFDLIEEKDLPKVVKFNLKNIILTNPGEKTWDLDFGVGIMQALFEPATAGLRHKIKERMSEQIEIYAPYIKVTNLGILYTGDGIANISLKYRILINNTNDNMDLQITSNLS